MLQQEALAAKDAGAQRLLKADADLDLRGAAQETVPLNHVLMPGTDFERHDVARKLSGERQFSSRSNGAIFRHEERAAAGHALEDAKESSATTHLGVCRELD
jgi:hypothetical protein